MYVSQNFLLQGTYNGQPAAIKVIDQLQNTNEEIRHEIQIMKSLKHPNIIKLLGWKSVGGKTNVAMNLLMGTVQDLLNDEGCFDENRFFDFLGDSTAAMRYLYERKIMHRDIKPENVLFGIKPLKFVVSDFGLSVRYNRYDEKFDEPMGTLRFMPPDALQTIWDNSKNYGIEFDIYSLAVTFYVSIVGEKPFQSRILNRLAQAKDLCQLIKNKVKGAIQFDGYRYHRSLRNHNFKNEFLLKQVEQLLSKMMEVSSTCIIWYFFNIRADFQRKIACSFVPTLSEIKKDLCRICQCIFYYYYLKCRFLYISF